MSKGILFNSEMVRAILAGRKTVTRRVVTVPWHKGKRTTPYEPYYIESDGKLLYMDEGGGFHPMEEISPYGQAGNVLWVRETWCPGYYADGRVGYKADWVNPDPRVVAETKWKPNIHMPRAAARLFLQVTNVRVERLNQITANDAKAEGIIDADDYEAVRKFEELWNSVNYDRGFGFAMAPWVWVIEFGKIDKEKGD